MAHVVREKLRQQIQGQNLLWALTAGHIAVHWFQQMWPVVIPSIRQDLGLTNVQLGTLASVKQSTWGPLNLPSGIMADFYRSKTALILGVALTSFGIAYALVSRAPTYFWLLPAVGLLGIGSVLWHPAALGSISRRHPERRASALAIHGSGASISDTISPIAIAALVALMGWRNMLALMLVPGLIIGLALWRGLDHFYRSEDAVRPSLRHYLKDVGSLMKHRAVLAIVGVNVCSGMASGAALTFLPVYLREDLHYSQLALGFHIGLLYAMGAVSQPILGILSDRYGRKPILLPSLVLFGLFYLALSKANPGVQMGLVIAALGLFFYALTTVTQATVMDVASDRVMASTMGITSILGQPFTLASPILAGFVVNQWGLKGVFVYSGMMVLFGATILALIHVPRSSRPTPRVGG